MQRSCSGRGLAVLAALAVAGCAAGPENVPYPAFVQVGELNRAFIAELPGVEARRLSGDMRSGRFSALLALPDSYRWNTGAQPGKSVELYVLAGDLTLSDLELTEGNHAYLPPGSLGMTMQSRGGARLLYFVDDASPDAVIQTPLFMSREVVPWKPISDAPGDSGIEIKELRSDPGSGARTWLMKVEPGAGRGWRRAEVAMEGFLLAGDYRTSECVGGKPVRGEYRAGGYFRRPAGAVFGGPETATEAGAIWLMRTPGHGTSTPVDACPAPGEAGGDDFPISRSE